MSTTHRPGRRLATLAALSLGVTFVGIAATSDTVGADAASPVGTTFEITVNHNDPDDLTDDTYTVTVSGTWEWPTHSTDCNLDRFATGWEVDWDDADQPGNPIGNTGVDVGAKTANDYNAADNTVDYPASAPRCGVYDPVKKYNSGTWGPISHTYGPGTDLSSIEPCVVTYDVQYKDSRNKDVPKDGKLVAGGSGRNTDNSVEANGHTPAGNECAPLTPPPGTLTLYKVVDNTAGGDLTADDFTLTATPVTPEIAPAVEAFVPFEIEGTDGVNDDALGQYTLSETDATDYVGSDWDCGDSAVVDGVVTVGPGQDVECTITNTFVPSHGTLTLYKVVVNDGGGTKTVDDFTLTATAVDGEGDPIVDGQVIEGTDGVDDDAVGDYLLSETDDPDYDASSWDCGDATIVGDIVTVEAGVDVECTITNTYNGEDSAPPTPPTTVARTIPETGSSSGTSLVAALVLCLLGAGAVFGARRRRTA